MDAQEGRKELGQDDGGNALGGLRGLCYLYVVKGEERPVVWLGKEGWEGMVLVDEERKDEHGFC